MSPNFLICCGKTVCLMNEAFSADEAVTRFGLYIGTTCGDSMEPMIRQGRDRVCIGRCSGRLRLYDVPLYRRPSGQLVLHRIVKVLPEEYVTCGDNRRKWERGVTDAMIIGILTGFYREGIFIDCRRSWKYRCYVFFWDVIGCTAGNDIGKAVVRISSPAYSSESNGLSLSAVCSVREAASSACLKMPFDPGLTDLFCKYDRMFPALILMNEYIQRKIIKSRRRLFLC